ncbi:MAG: hypothetical protein ASARMPREDX12_003449 [Alectoria sarmentosa]|nr:MAG: hypothetical protein ASARMPREDX12_003449 [Alectoria sarmentosa]
MSANADDHALADMTNKIANVQVNEAALERVKGAKWGTPEGYDYTRYTTGPSDKTAPASEPDQPQADASTWAANAVRYVWEEEFGDVGPQHKELERILFGDEHKMEQGEEFSKLTEIGVTFESETKIKPVASFEDAGLHPVMLANVKLCGYKVPTPIQAYCLPSVLKGIDIIGIAQTGSGKTAAFLIPTLSKLMGKAKKLAAPRPNLTKPWTREDGVRAEPLILIVAPTRELATQIFDEARRLCYRSMLRPCVIYGGAPSGEQMDELRKGCDVLIATPGRLMDFMSRGHLLSLSRVKYTIIDEADEMVSPDWVEEMRNVMGGSDANADDDHVYMMFSATFPKEARAVAKEYMSKDHIRIRVLFVDEPKKRDCLFDLLLSMPPARTIVFVNNKKAADFLDDFLYNRGLPSTSIHSDRTQREREDAISAKAPLLVATGVSARGLDIKNVMHVINYDLPNSDYGGINEYVHRIGRTARIGNIGMATSFYNDKNEDIAEALTKLLIETHQVVPDFLESYKPENEELKFDDDTDDEGDDAAASDAWGGGTQTNGTANDDASGDAWGIEAPAADTNGGWN